MPNPPVSEAEVREAYELVADILARIGAVGGAFGGSLTTRSSARAVKAYREACAEFLPKLVDVADALVIDLRFEELLRAAAATYPPGSSSVRFGSARATVLEGMRDPVWRALSLATEPDIALYLWGHRFAPDEVAFAREARRRLSPERREQDYRKAWLAKSRDEVVSASEFLEGLADLDLSELSVAAEREFRAMLDRTLLATTPATSQVTASDDPDLRPASEFPKRLGARLREATATDRKSKRVRWELRDGVKLYSMTDARRWWPKAFK